MFASAGCKLYYLVGLNILFFLRLIFQFRISNSVVIYIFNLFRKYLFYCFYVSEAYRGIFKLPIGNLRINHIFNHFADALIGILIKCPGACFNRIGHHQDGSFFAVRYRTRIHKVLFVG